MTRDIATVTLVVVTVRVVIDDGGWDLIKAIRYFSDEAG